jgi:hypothetical protein
MPSRTLGSALPGLHPTQSLDMGDPSGRCPRRGSRCYGGVPNLAEPGPPTYADHFRLRRGAHAVPDDPSPGRKPRLPGTISPPPAAPMPAGDVNRASSATSADRLEPLGTPRGHRVLASSRPVPSRRRQCRPDPRINRRELSSCQCSFQDADGPLSTSVSHSQSPTDRQLTFRPGFKLVHRVNRLRRPHYCFKTVPQAVTPGPGCPAASSDERLLPAGTQRDQSRSFGVAIMGDVDLDGAGS